MILVSIITPVYNASKYLPSVYQALCKQTHSEWEWLVVDDCSKDSSAQYLKGLEKDDPRVRFFSNETNSGPSVARNRGINESRGSYIAFLDSDDLWDPKKLETQLAFMQNSHSRFSCHDYTIITESGVFFKEVSIPQRVTYSDLSAYNPLATSFVMIEKTAIGELRFNPALKRRQDWIFWYELSKKGHPCYSLSQNLGFYRKDSQNSISRNKFHMAMIQWQLYREFFKFGFFESIWSFVRYSFYGIKKHYLR